MYFIFQWFLENERDFKTNTEHWEVVVNFFELYPELIKNSFKNNANNKSNLNQKWQQLADNLNALGYGSKSVNKLQLVRNVYILLRSSTFDVILVQLQAIGRWKSKVKLKASQLRKEMIKTGGGESKIIGLTNLEDRLMTLHGWKAITGDGNIELGLVLGNMIY